MNLVCWQYGMDVPAGPPAFKRGNLTSCRMCSAIFYSSVRSAPSCFYTQYGDGGSCKQHLSPPQFPRCICHASASSGIKMHLLLSCENWGPCRLYTQGRRMALSREEDTAALSRFIATDLPMQHKSRIPHKMCGGRLYRCIYYILSNGSINSLPAKKSRKCSNGI